MNYLSKENVQEVLNLTRLTDDFVADETAATTAGAQIAQVAYRVEGVLDPARLQLAWDHLIQAHPLLRSVFRSMKNRMVQVVLKTRPLLVEVKDARVASSVEVQTLVEEILTAQRVPIVPSEGPLMRLCLVQTDEQQGVLLWTYHQLLLDERSRGLILADVLATYGALTHGESLPTLNRPNYKEYLKWLAGQDWSEVKIEWSEQLAGFEAPTQLLNGPRVHQAAGVRDVQNVQLTEPVSHLLNGLAQKQGVTGDAIAHAAWALLLNIYSGEEDVFYGATLSGRPADLQGAPELIGRFMNTLPARVKVDGNQSVVDLLHAVQKQQLFLQKYAYLPLNEVRDHSGVDAGVTLFDSALAVYTGHGHGQEQGHPSATFEGAALRMEATQWGSDAVPLTIDVVLGEVWQVMFSTARQAWDKETVQRMQAHFVTLLESLAKQPGALVRELNVLPETERQQLFLEFNETLLPQPDLTGLAHQVIEEQVAKRPDEIACLFNGGQLTYQELNERANRLAHWLREQGFGRDDLAALFAERSSDMLVAIVAVLKAGGAYVPLDSANPDQRLRTIVENSKAKVILTQNELTNRSKALANGLSPEPLIFCLERATQVNDVPDVETLQAYSRENLVFINEPSDLANVFFTSGSTGLPKGAMIEHIGMLNHLYAKINLLGLTENSVVVQNASHCFDISVWQFLAPLMTGGTVAIYGNDTAGDPHALLASVRRDHATVLEMVPAMIEMFLYSASEVEASARELHQLHYMISTGEGLPVPLMRKWLQAYPHVRVVNTYGATECSDDTSHEVVEGVQGEGQSYVTLGKPIPNFKTYLLDRWNRLVPIGCVGEICLTGIGVGRGYLNDPERTAKAFVSNPFDDGTGERMYRTGDLGRYMTSGELLFVSRIDHQVKVRGHRIELGEIESVLRSEPAVQICVAVVKPDNHGQNRIIAYVVGEGLQVDTLREKLQSRLPEYMIPEHIVLLDAMPLNRNGKIDRKALPDPHDVARSAETLAGPRNEIEAKLVKIYEEVLGTSPIGIEDNFFHLGGHSLRTIQVRSRVKHSIGVDIPLKKLFELQTVAQLGVYVSRMTGLADGEEQQIPRVPKAETYPMSRAQRRLYFLQLLDRKSIAFNMPSAYELQGPLELKPFRQAFQMLVDRHATLRTTFAFVDGQPVQRVATRLEFTYQACDLSKLSAEEREHAVKAFLHQEHHLPFDLEKGQLFRVRLLKLEENRHVLMMNMHHIISDIWSWQVLQREFVTLYSALLVGQSDDVLLPLTIQYVDFAQWQNQRLANGEMESQERYWLDKLSGELPVLSIPTDFLRPPVQLFNGSYVASHLSKEMVEGINKLTQQSDSTLFMVLLAATGLLLQRLSGQHDLIVGTPEAGRNRVELEELIGFFINTLPLRLDVQTDANFLSLLEQVKQTAVDAYEHQEYPFDLLVDKLNPVRDLSRPPILSVMFQVIRHTETEQVDGLQLKNLPMELETSQIDLYFAFIESQDGLEMVIDYSTDLFEHTTVTRWLGYFESLMKGILANPQLPLAQLAVVEEAEQKQLLTAGNGTVVDFPVSCIHERFEAQVERTPNVEAVVYANGSFSESLTYAELNRMANRVAHHLQGQGIGPEKTVAIRMERSLEMVVAVLGVLKAGGAYVPIDPVYPAERVAFILEDTQAEVVLTQQHLMYSVPRSGAKVICVDADWARFAEASGDNPSCGVRPENVAYVMYTSGSTGQPKGVLVEHRSVSNLLDAQREACGITAGSRVLQFASLSFDPSVFEMFTALTVGAKLIVASKETLQPGPKMTAFMREQGITFATLTPAVLALLDPEELPVLRTVGCGGEVCSLELVEKWAVGRTFLNIYGPTEATVMSTWNLSQKSSVSATIGRPIANVQAYILDGNMQPVPVGMPGELYLGGAGLARGYLNRPELTAERFVVNPFSMAIGARLYKTGDSARFLGDDSIEFLMRLDEQVKIRGIRVELGEVEQTLKQHLSVREAIVLAREDVPGDKRLVAYVVGHESTENSSDVREGLQQKLPAHAETLIVSDLRRFLQHKVPEFMIPAHIVLLDALPLTRNGKVDRRALPKPDELQAGRETQYVAPRDALELQLVGVWEELLGVRPVGVRDNFFNLGGHSLLAVRLLAHIQSAFGVELPLSTLFHGGTIELLAQFIRREEEVVWNLLVPIQGIQKDQASVVAKPPFFAVHPIGGSVICYRELALALGTDQPFYGLQARGMEGDEEPFAHIEEMAADYVEAIRSVQQTGPYHLGGWSFGGVVAFEMARLLREQGHEIATLVLFDSLAPDEAFRAKMPGDVALLQQFVAELAGTLGANVGEAQWVEDLGQVEIEVALEKLWKQAVHENLLPQDLELAQFCRLFHMFRSHLNAYYTYTPLPYEGDLMLFKAAEQSSEQNSNGWTEWVAGELEVHVLSGDHFSLLRAPHTAVLAERLNARLQEKKKGVVSHA